MRYLYDWNEAEDLVQEAYFTLWCNLDKYDGERNIIAYLLTYVKNACLKYIRNLKIQDNNQDKIIEAMLFSNITDEEPDEKRTMRGWLPNGTVILSVRVICHGSWQNWISSFICRGRKGIR